MLNIYTDLPIMCGTNGMEYSLAVKGKGTLLLSELLLRRSDYVEVAW